MSDHAQNVAFVKTVEKYPCLYNYSLSDYVNRERLNEAWNEVAKKTNLSMLECKRKWKNLRSVFVRKSKPVIIRQGRQRPYYLNKCMEFLKPYIKVGTGRNFESVTSQPIIQQEGDEEEQDEQEELLEDYIETQDSEDGHASDASTTGFYTEPPQKKNCRAKSNLDFEQDIIEYLSKKYCAEPTRTTTNKRETQDSEGADASDQETATFYIEPLNNKKHRAKSNRDVGPETGGLSNDKYRDDSARTKSNKRFLLSLLPDLASMTDEQIRGFKRNTLAYIDEVLHDAAPRSYAESYALPVSVQRAPRNGSPSSSHSDRKFLYPEPARAAPQPDPDPLDSAPAGARH